VLLLAACASEPDWPPAPGHPESAADLFSSERIWDIDIRLSANAIEALRVEPRVYVEGDIYVGDLLIERVGVRLKGNFSFQSLGGKSSFKIDFDQLVRGQRLVGLEKLTLNNMRQDRSQVHESLGYQVFRAAGVPAPRSGFARVHVNGQPYGLYANVESVDHRFLEVNYADGDGNLYEAAWGADLTPEAMDRFEQDAGDDLSRADLAELIDRVGEPGDGVFFAADAPIDTTEFLRFVAVEAVIGHWDGYWKSNNYSLYHEPGRDLWSFMPWGLDQAFDRELHPFTSAGALADKCFENPRCLAEYSRIGLEVVDAFEALEPVDALDHAAALLEDSVDSDPRSPHPMEKVQRFWDITRATVAAAPDRLRARFSCTAGGVEVDRDGDGFGGCMADCNDDSAAAHPGAGETCDGLDNDCDGYVDEASCPCDATEVGGTTYLFCSARVSWTVARNECQARGGKLATLSDRADSVAAFAVAESIEPERSWYIGVHDRIEEGTWVSAEAEDMRKLHFAPGEPDDFGNEDCAVLASFAGGLWADVQCNTPQPYICEVGE